MKEKIGITACSDPMKPEFQSNMDRLCAILSDVGYEPVISNCIYPKIYPEAYGLHGTGAERAAELMKLYTDPAITSIFDISGDFKCYLYKNRQRSSSLSNPQPSLSTQ